jgi:hypothetical protein
MKLGVGILAIDLLVIFMALTAPAAVAAMPPLPHHHSRPDVSLMKTGQ